jgi:hypothetical protein
MTPTQHTKESTMPKYTISSSSREKDRFSVLRDEKNMFYAVNGSFIFDEGNRLYERIKEEVLGGSLEVSDDFVLYKEKVLFENKRSDFFPAFRKGVFGVYAIEHNRIDGSFVSLCDLVDKIKEDFELFESLMGWLQK